MSGKGKEKAYRCEECGQCFTQRSNLSRHKTRVHRVVQEDKRKLTCKECNKEFSRTDVLKVHLASGTCAKIKERIEARCCKICGKSFSAPWQMRRHMMIHKDKSYPCTTPGCNHSFPKKILLKEHKKSCGIAIPVIKVGGTTKRRVGRPRKAAETGQLDFENIVNLWSNSTTERSTGQQLYCDGDANENEDDTEVFSMCSMSRRDVPSVCLDSPSPAYNQCEDVSRDESDIPTAIPLELVQGVLTEPSSSLELVQPTEPSTSECPASSTEDSLIVEVNSRLDSEIALLLSLVETLIPTSADDGEFPNSELSEQTVQCDQLDIQGTLSSVSSSRTGTPIMTPSDYTTQTPHSASKRLTSSVRVQKHRAVTEITKFITTLFLKHSFEDEMKVSIMIGVLKKIQMLDKVKQTLKGKRGGDRRSTPVIIVQKVFDFWLANSSVSTDSKRPAKLNIKQRPSIVPESLYQKQENVKLETDKRKRTCYVSPWFFYESTVRDLFDKFKASNPGLKMSIGTFLKLRPFFIRARQQADLEVCCCKVHVNMYYAHRALFQICEKETSSDLATEISSDNYRKTLANLAKDCPHTEEQTSHIPWDCLKNGEICEHIKKNWSNIKEKAKSLPKDVKVQFPVFVKDEETGRLTQNKEHKAIDEVIEYLDKCLKKFIIHRNHLKHFRTTYPQVTSTLDSDVPVISLDFSENLTLPVRFEPQEMHWVKTQCSIHCGILRNDMKIYQGVMSDDNGHDQCFVAIALEELVTVFKEIHPECKTVFVNSDNCSSQYKSAHHFFHLQELATSSDVTIVRIYGISGHGKSEIDCVGSVLKIACRKAIADGEFLHNTEDCVLFLNNKFGDNSQGPSYLVNEINQALLEEQRGQCSRKQFPTITGSSKFQVMVFSPNTNKILTAPKICTCQNCLDLSYESCETFTTVEFNITQLIHRSTRGDSGDQTVREPAVDNETADDVVLPAELIVPNTICAILASGSSSDNFYLVEILRVFTPDNDVTDQFNHTVSGGIECVEVHYLEKKDSNPMKGDIYYTTSAKVFVFKEDIVYPAVSVEKRGKKIFLKNSVKTEINYFIESAGLLSNLS